ncbi:MAG: glycosyltransferase [Verrucomicrobiota bacterium]
MDPELNRISLKPLPLVRATRNHIRQTLIRRRARAAAVNWAKSREFDVIYSYPLGRHPFYHELAVEISKTLQIPLVIHVMDDWLLRLEKEYQRSGNLRAWQKEESSWLNLFDHASGHIGISPEMESAYLKRYGRTFIPIANSIDFESWNVRRDSYQAKDPFKIVYVGGLSKEKEFAALKRFRDAVLSLRESGLSLQWIIHSGISWQDTLNSEFVVDSLVVNGGPISHDTLPEKLNEADLLVLALNFDELSAEYLALSIQNKVPEYMASGTPILAFGPSGNPSIEYAKRERWAMVVDIEDPLTLQSALKTIMNDVDRRREIGMRAREIALKNHQHQDVQRRFINILRSAAA